MLVLPVDETVDRVAEWSARSCGGRWSKARVALKSSWVSYRVTPSRPFTPMDTTTPACRAASPRVSAFDAAAVPPPPRITEGDLPDGEALSEVMKLGMRKIRDLNAAHSSAAKNWLLPLRQVAAFVDPVVDDTVVRRNAQSVRVSVRSGGRLLRSKSEAVYAHAC